MTLVCLCASHIDTDFRILQLKNMLRSWNSQDHKILMIMSISCENFLHKEFEELMLYITKYNMLIVNNEKYQKKSQFVHYKIIAEKYSNILESKWIIFSDDDDIWLKQRSLVFCKLIKEHCDTDFILYPYIYASNKYFSSPEEVLIEIHNNNVIKTIHDNVSEYICFATKFVNLKNFVTQKNSVIVDKYGHTMELHDILTNSFADRYFVAYLKIIAKNNYKKITNANLDGVYYYYNTKFSIVQDPIEDKNFFTYIPQNKLII